MFFGRNIENFIIQYWNINLFVTFFRFNKLQKLIEGVWEYFLNRLCLDRSITVKCSNKLFHDIVCVYSIASYKKKTG